MKLENDKASSCIFKMSKFSDIFYMRQFFPVWSWCVSLDKLTLSYCNKGLQSWMTEWIFENERTIAWECYILNVITKFDIDDSWIERKLRAWLRIERKWEICQNLFDVFKRLSNSIQLIHQTSLCIHRNFINFMRVSIFYPSTFSQYLKLLAKLVTLTKNFILADTSL